MDVKRDLTSVDIAALVGELGAYAGAGVEKVYLYPDSRLLRFRLHEYERGRIELLVDFGERKHARIAAPEHVPDAPERPPDFAMMLRNRLKGAELSAVSQFEFDRILRLAFERGADSTTIVAELFGDGNVAVLDETGSVINCVETVRLKSRTVAPGATYEYPDARFNPLSVDRDGFDARMRDSDTDVVRTLATQLNFGGLWGEELCSRAGVEKTRSIGEVTDAELAKLYDTIRELATVLSAGDLDARVYYAGPDSDASTETAEEDGEEGADGSGDALVGRRVDATPLTLEERAHLPADRFERFTDALDDYYANFAGEGAQPEGEGEAGRDRPDFESEIEKRERIIDQQEAAIEDFADQAAELRAAAEALYAHYDLVSTVLSTVREAREDEISWEEIQERLARGAERGIPAAEAVVDIDGSTGTVTLSVGDYRATLEVDTGVEKNADRLYQEAKRIEEKQAGAETAVEETRDELEEIERRREEWDAEPEDREDASAEADGNAAGAGGTTGETAAAAAEESSGGDDVPAEKAVDWLARESIPVRSSEQWYEQFRWFHTTEGYLVIGGRNADQNEALVQKYLERGDRFFHAQAHGGPATILKATGPSEATSDDIELPESSQRQAATFALSYSSVWKDGHYAGDVYAVDSDQVSKTPESGEYLEKGGFAIRDDRDYYNDHPVGVAVGITCEPDTRVIGGPVAAIQPAAATAVELEPGRFAQNDAAKKVYHEFRDRFTDEAFVRKVASPDLIQEFLPPGGSRIVD